MKTNHCTSNVFNILVPTQVLLIIQQKKLHHINCCIKATFPKFKFPSLTFLPHQKDLKLCLTEQLKAAESIFEQFKVNHNRNTLLKSLTYGEQNSFFKFLLNLYADLTQNMIFHGFTELEQLNLPKKHALNESENRSIPYYIISNYIYTSKCT